MMEINYENLTDNELGEMYQLCAMELEKRKTQKQSKEWKKIVESLREWVKKYGLAVSIDGEEEMVLDGTESDEDFDKIFYTYGPGVIYQYWK